MESTEAEVHDKLEAIPTTQATTETAETTETTTEIEAQANAPENVEVNTIEEFEATVLAVAGAVEGAGVEVNANAELLNRITALEASFAQLSNSLSSLETKLAQYATTNAVEQVSQTLQSQASAIAEIKASFASEIIDIKAGAASTESANKGVEIKSNIKPSKSQVTIKADWLDTYLGTGSKADKTAN